MSIDLFWNHLATWHCWILAAAKRLQRLKPWPCRDLQRLRHFGRTMDHPPQRDSCHGMCKYCSESTWANRQKQCEHVHPRANRQCMDMHGSGIYRELYAIIYNYIHTLVCRDLPLAYYTHLYIHTMHEPPHLGWPRASWDERRRLQVLPAQLGPLSQGQSSPQNWARRNEAASSESQQIQANPSKSRNQMAASNAALQQANPVSRALC